MTDQLTALAARFNRKPAEVYEYWSERAAIREHDAGYPRAEAERLAVEDVEAWLRETKGQGR